MSVCPTVCPFVRLSDRLSVCSVCLGVGSVPFLKRVCYQGSDQCHFSTDFVPGGLVGAPFVRYGKSTLAMKSTANGQTNKRSRLRKKNGVHLKNFGKKFDPKFVRIKQF